MLLSSLLIVFLVAVDQISKFFVEDFFLKQSELQAFDLIPGFIECRYSQNTGIAFSLFDNQADLLTLINTVVIAAIIFFFYKSQQKLNISKLGYIFIIGGGLGNLIDRYFRSYVVDFINPTFVDFAIFNLADCFLNIGVLLIIWEMLFNASKRA
jgi:signal peptidase II